MTKALSDAQLTILSAACQREDRSVYPLSTKLTGGALAKVLASLIDKELLEETPAGLQDTVWRTEESGSRLTLRARPDADAALGIGEAIAGQEPQEDGDAKKPIASAARAGRSVKAGSARKGRSPGPKGKAGPAKGASARQRRANDGMPRSGTKQAKLIAMLQRKNGATIEEIVKALDWQPHTVRGAIAGALKKRLKLKVVSERVEGRGRVYSVAE